MRVFENLYAATAGRAERYGLFSDSGSFLSPTAV